MRTPGGLAKDFDVKLDRVLYAIRSREIEPVAVCGGYRIYDELGAEQVRDALETIAGRGRAGTTSQS